MRLLVINGPNMQLLGKRRSDFYGVKTLPQIESELHTAADALGVSLVFFQSNHEGAICDRIAEAMTEGIDGIIINPAAYTHTSVAIRDALEASSIPAVEVHMSNVRARDEFRRVSYTEAVCIGQITGFGADGYELALRGLVRYLAERAETITS